MSGAGKSLITAGLCRIFKQDGYRVAPFKSQNMALNSYITSEGLEMGRAQVMQAEAAGIEPSVHMNPILLKPTNDVGSQVIVNGEVIGNMSAREYFAFKKKLVPDIKKAFSELEKQADIIVIEGAGSPAEINLKENDIVNMGMAELVDAPVLLVGDIDRGGVFAQLLGTVMLLEERERARVKGLIINKFRGDKTLLDPGIVMLEQKLGQQLSNCSGERLRQQPEPRLRQQPEPRLRQQPELQLRQQPEPRLRQQPEPQLRQQPEPQLRQQSDQQLTQQSEPQLRQQLDQQLTQQSQPLFRQQSERALGRQSEQQLAPQSRECKHIPVLGVVPYMNVRLEDEDSLTERFDRRCAKAVDLAVIRYPRISNFTDFDVFEQAEGASLRYVQNVAE